MRKFLALALFCAAGLSGVGARADETGWPPVGPEPCKPCWIEPWLCKAPPCPAGPKRVQPDSRVSIDDDQPKTDPDSSPPKPQPKSCRQQQVDPL